MSNRKKANRRKGQHQEGKEAPTAVGANAPASHMPPLGGQPADAKEEQRQGAAWTIELPKFAGAMATIATNAWRAKGKMVDASTGEPREEMRRAYRHIESILDALQEFGVEIVDPIGQAFDSGLAFKAVSFEPTPGLSKEEITETIRPSVRYCGNLLQIGEVVVGTPTAQ